MRQLFTTVHQILTSAIHCKQWRITPIPLGFVIQQQIQCFTQISWTHCAMYCGGRITVQPITAAVSWESLLLGLTSERPRDVTPLLKETSESE